MGSCLDTDIDPIKQTKRQLQKLRNTKDKLKFYLLKTIFCLFHYFIIFLITLINSKAITPG